MQALPGFFFRPLLIPEGAESFFGPPSWPLLRTNVGFFPKVLRILDIEPQHFPTPTSLTFSPLFFPVLASLFFF